MLLPEVRPDTFQFGHLRRYFYPIFNQTHLYVTIVFGSIPPAMWFKHCSISKMDFYFKLKRVPYVSTKRDIRFISNIVIRCIARLSCNFNFPDVFTSIMLAGIVVNNAILLVDTTNLLRRRDNMSLEDAVREAGRRRLRPILMTTLTTVLGLLPLALGFGEGGENQAPLARAVIGGLLSSTMITLFFIPAVYSIAESILRRKKSL